ncbi:40-kDa huntingtin-associated protein-like [Hylaeus anthracinus]|uniref:40-kDa huntingtin-associated protein-like n=1 Tax=Hylaeus volcanicus TaxID=313075 RepID=UPI0023B7B633|nr:40-kDa huntingtin-associated protein-like [Hylaeus volcanicus]XP_054014310.1 40-kDa huntingtin-associated protein-like [Hylaeus anthracinus]
MAHLKQRQIMGDSLDFLTKYHSISNKLKKRFLRKPNVAEASDHFGALATECEQKELWQYAGLCSLAAARCQGTLENVFPELNFLIKAGREFLVADKKDKDIGCPSIGQENTQAAISCFGHALARCQNQPGFNTMSAGLALELALALDSTPAGIQQLRKAIDIFPTAKAINTLVSYHINQGDYVSALQILNEFVEFIETYINTGARGNYSVILHRCEVTRVLLLLILQPSPQRLAPSLAQVLEKYAWIEETANNDFNMSENELLLLQSLVLASQSHDYQALLELEGELWPYLDAEQKELLHKLIQILTAQ